MKIESEISATQYSSHYFMGLEFRFHSAAHLDSEKMKENKTVCRRNVFDEMVYEFAYIEILLEIFAFSTIFTLFEWHTKLDLTVDKSGLQTDVEEGEKKKRYIQLLIFVPLFPPQQVSFFFFFFIWIYSFCRG